ncbi:MAG: rhomboid family intramembrane serine protease [Prevotella sp.]|nr:rhomboid family intramembrane serine protease [Prevotella sp.]
MRNMPPITKNLLIINTICFLAFQVLSGRGVNLNDIFGLHYIQAADFRSYQLVTYMFMHATFMHLFFNMFALWMFGGIIERTFGQRRFLLFYFVCGLGAAFCQELSQAAMLYSVIAEQGGTLADMFSLSQADRLMLNSMTTVGASGSIYGILLAFGVTYPEERMFIFPLPVPVKAKWFVCGYVVIELFMALSQRGDGVAHVAHLGGMLFGYTLIKAWRKRSSSFNGWDGYEIKDKSQTILGRIRRWLHLDRDNDANEDLNYGRRNSSAKNSREWDYNAKNKKEEDEIDKILDKIRRSGYQSLTDEEKQKLFDRK